MEQELKIAILQT